MSGKPKKDRLSPKEKVFVEAYTSPDSPTKLNATQSYRVAYPGSGYDTANNAGHLILKREVVQRSVREVLDSLNLTEKVCINMNRLIESACEADAKDWRAQKLGLEAGNFIKDVYGWKQPDQHLHIAVTPEDRAKKYEELTEKVLKLQKDQKKETVDAVSVT